MNFDLFVVLSFVFKYLISLRNEINRNHKINIYRSIKNISRIMNSATI